MNSEKPWLATAAYIIPHLPLVCDEKFSRPFLEEGLSQDRRKAAPKESSDP
ncbi:MAG: hypothetical protein ACYC6Y_21125 [Thermoguttaceae bacterium]